MMMTFRPSHLWPKSSLWGVKTQYRHLVHERRLKGRMSRMWNLLQSKEGGAGKKRN